MSQLNDRNFHLVIDVSKSVSFVVHNELEDAQPPRGLELVGVGWTVGCCLLQSHLVVWVEHCELELDVLGVVSDPLSVLLLVDVDEVLDVYLSLVVLRVGGPFISYFPVSYFLDLKDASFLQVPFDELCAQLVV